MCLGKQYNNHVEEEERRLVFESNMQFINDHNLQYNKGEQSYFLAVNQFADMVNIDLLHLVWC